MAAPPTPSRKRGRAKSFATESESGTDTDDLGEAAPEVPEDADSTGEPTASGARDFLLAQKGERRPPARVCDTLLSCLH